MSLNNYPIPALSLRWLYVDFNSYFASVEQQLHPELRGKPIAVVAVETDSWARDAMTGCGRDRKRTHFWSGGRAGKENRTVIRIDRSMQHDEVLAVAGRGRRLGFNTGLELCLCRPLGIDESLNQDSNRNLGLYARAGWQKNNEKRQR